MAGSEASSTEPTWPDESELFKLVVAMLTGGNGSPAAPAKVYAVAKATHTLLVRVQVVVKKLMKEHAGQTHPVPGTAGRIDQQEARGYLLATGARVVPPVSGIPHARVRASPGGLVPLLRSSLRTRDDALCGKSLVPSRVNDSAVRARLVVPDGASF